MVFGTLDQVAQLTEQPVPALNPTCKLKVLLQAQQAVRSPREKKRSITP